jgi:hypothetical protein
MLWRHIVLYVGYQRFGGLRCLHLQGEDEGGIIFRSVVILPQHTWRHILEDLDLNLHLREKLKSRVVNI